MSSNPNFTSREPGIHHNEPVDLVILGASNVTLGLPQIVSLIQQSKPSSIRAWIAHGHGRSYGTWSSALFRSLPGIRDCGIWDAIRHEFAHESRQDRVRARRLAILTDIGNDLIYGTSARTLERWCSECISRLEELGFSVLLTQLPLSSIESLSRTRYRVVKAVFFPNQKTGWERLREQVDAMAGMLDSLGNHPGRNFFAPPASWYGFDPIHIRRSVRLQAWRDLLTQHDLMDLPASPRNASWFSAFRLWLHAPAERRLFGRSSEQGQPSIERERLTVSFY